MDNVRVIRKNENLCFILSEEHAYSTECKALEKTAVIACLYYIDTVEVYFSYLNNIPIEIPRYIVSSNPLIWDKALLYINEKKENKIYLIKKENRGRDISALLVSCRRIIEKYKYICFVHDKKSKFEFLKEDVEKWIANLWGNCLKSEDYIKNVMNLFEKEKKIGLLVPPEPIGEYINVWYSDCSWGVNFENTKKLAETLQLRCDISEEFPPITLGTVFWGECLH